MKKTDTAGVSSGSTTKTYVSCALFAALTCVIAPVSIPLPGGVPITLQQVTVMLAGLLLSPKLGFLSQLIYVLLGAFGLPV
ncbi:MAG: biotin transporter BioY, partial [Acidaminococcaceae bacterium]|nr:biotin transporter BioY [Acidaminococcaceae bacterium]